MFAIFQSLGSSLLSIDFLKIFWRMGADSLAVSFNKRVERASKPAALFGSSFWSNIVIPLVSMMSQSIYIYIVYWLVVSLQKHIYRQEHNKQRNTA